MFVKLINHNKEEAIQKASPRTHCFDVRNYILSKSMKNREDEATLIFNHGDRDERWISFTRKDHTVIIMGNDGKTVDRYSW